VTASSPNDLDRRAVLQELISRLTAMVAEAQVLTTAALRFDKGSLAEATTTLARMSSDPALEVTRTSEVYAALRRAVVARSPVRPRATPAQSSLVELAARRQRSLVEAFPVPRPPQPRSPSPQAG
jgi:hypothetical protein